MTKNPFINAFTAATYIITIASIMFYGTKNMAGPDHSVIIPFAMISLFTLSAAVMSYLFMYQPLQLFMDGKKKNAVNLFLQTVAVFAGITFFAFTLLFSGILF